MADLPSWIALLVVVNLLFVGIALDAINTILTGVKYGLKHWVNVAFLFAVPILTYDFNTIWWTITIQ